MSVIRVQRFALLLAGLAWTATAYTALSGQTEGTGIWHHFGEVVTAAEPTEPGAWHRFGDTGTSPKVNLPETARVPTLASASVMEMEMFELVNRARSDPTNSAETDGRALPLKWNASLAAVAREHSRDMLVRGYFEHNDPDGRSPGTRVKAAGITWQATAENIAAFDSVTGAEAAFMNEPRFAHNHRANILSPKYTEVGIGIVRSRSGRYYITQEFMEPTADLRAAFPQ